MASCASCNSRIFVGGKRDGDSVYCNNSCLAEGGKPSALLLACAAHIPQRVVMATAIDLRDGDCPSCGKTGSPVDYRVSHRALSFVLMTTWSSHGQICCRRCGVKALLGNSALTLLVGWWGLPWGLIATPIQLLRNLAGLVLAGQGTGPSAQMLQRVRMQLARRDCGVIPPQRARMQLARRDCGVIPPQPRLFRLELSDGSILEKTGHVEEQYREGKLSHCRVIMSRLPTGFVPDNITRIRRLADGNTKNGEAVAETFTPEGPLGRGNSLVLSASFLEKKVPGHCPMCGVKIPWLWTRSGGLCGTCSSGVGTQLRRDRSAHPH